MLVVQLLCRVAEAVTAICYVMVVSHVNNAMSQWHTLLSSHFSATSKFCGIQDTSTQDPEPPRESGTLTDQSHRSMSGQHSLRSHQSLQARSPAPPASASWQNPEASAEAGAAAGAAAADDKAPKESDATLSEGDKGKAAREGPSMTSSQGGPRADAGAQGTSVSKSPFEQWRAEGQSGSSTQKGQTKVIPPEIPACSFSVHNTHKCLYFLMSCLGWHDCLCAAECEGTHN